MRGAHVGAESRAPELRRSAFGKMRGARGWARPLTQACPLPPARRPGSPSGSRGPLASRHGGASVSRSARPGRARRVRTQPSGCRSGARADVERSGFLHFAFPGVSRKGGASGRAVAFGTTGPVGAGVTGRARQPDKDERGRGGPCEVTRRSGVARCGVWVWRDRRVLALGSPLEQGRFWEIRAERGAQRWLQRE